MSSETRVAASQGGEFSYHGEAAKQLFGEPIEILDCDTFGDVVKASRSFEPGLGIIAIRSAAGTIDRSAASIVRARPSALPTITGRIDLEVSLVLIGSQPIDIEERREQRTFVHSQNEAWVQCDPEVRSLLHRAKARPAAESTKAIRMVLDMDRPDHLAIGPAHAAEPLGGHILSSSQLNPIGSFTRFYALQRDPNLPLFGNDPHKTSERTVVSLAHPEGYREMDKVTDLIKKLGIVSSDFITFAIGDVTKHRDDQKRAGGIFEFEIGRYDADLLEFCARVNGLNGNDGAHGPFSAKTLGSFAWYPQAPMYIDNFANTYDSEPTKTKNQNSAEPPEPQAPLPKVFSRLLSR